MYFDQALLLLFVVIIFLNSYTYRYDSKALKYNLDYQVPKPSKFLVGVLFILINAFYGLSGLYLYNLYPLM